MSSSDRRCGAAAGEDRTIRAYRRIAGTTNTLRSIVSHVSDGAGGQHRCAQLGRMFFEVEARYLAAARDEWDREWGSIDGFVAGSLGIGPAETARLRARLIG